MEDTSLQSVWQAYQQGGLPSLPQWRLTSPMATFYAALLAYHHGELGAALRLTHAAVEAAPSHPVYAAARLYLERRLAATDADASVYTVTPDGFSAFIRGGGNVPLYEHTSAALRAAYLALPSVNLLDVGTGDGLALLPALAPSLRYIDLLEPSAALLAQTQAALVAAGVPVAAHNMTIQAFMQQGDGAWDIAQATFSLQAVPPQERQAVLNWLHDHAAQVLMAEFDVPDFTDPLAPERVAYVLERYAHGLAEYATDGGLVAQGFLMPVMFGYFSGGRRENWEQPLAGWQADLHAAGFATVTVQPIYEYWWAPAYLITAR